MLGVPGRQTVPSNCPQPHGNWCSGTKPTPKPRPQVSLRDSAAPTPLWACTAPRQREPGCLWNSLLPECSGGKKWVLLALKCMLWFLLSSRCVKAWLTCRPAPSCTCPSVGPMGIPMPMNASSVWKKCKLRPLAGTSWV